MRAIVGLLKGGLIGGALGFGFMQLGGLLAYSFFSYLLYGLIGALVGLIAGKPLWRHETIWTPVIKALFGVGVCIGLYALVVKVLGDPSLGLFGLHAPVSSVPAVLGALCGIAYGVFVEIDDGEKTEKKKKADPAG